MNPVDSESTFLTDAMARMGFAGEIATFERLSGGVSCDVWKVRLKSGRELAVKRAIPVLRVAAEWRASVARNGTEVAWLRLVTKLHPGWAPQVVGEDPAGHVFAMEYLPIEKHPVWKGELAAGRASAAFAQDVGRALVHIHAATAGSDAIAAQFSHGDQFSDLRLEPYLLFTAAKHPELAGRIQALAEGVARARLALMQGDVSPKNILCGPEGPVFLDAETACYGDPAFDLAFCLNHLLLKGVWHPEHREVYTSSFRALTAAYLDGVDWEEAEEIDARTAALLPALLLARVDGKSPVEYLVQGHEQAFVRETARTMLHRPPQNLDDLLSMWTEKLAYFAGSR